MYVKTRHVNDLIIYLQKTYGLYFVEFRNIMKAKQELVLCNPNNKHWWIHLSIHRFKTLVTVACAGENDCKMSEVRFNIEQCKYIGASEAFDGKWLKL